MKRLLTLLALSFALALTATAQLRQEFQDIDVNQLRKLQMVHVAVTELYVDTVLSLYTHLTLPTIYSV